MKIVSAVLVILVAVADRGESYRRLKGADEARFYRSRAAAYRGQRIHLHLPVTPFRKKPDRVQPIPNGPVYDRYTHRKVTLLVRPGNPYYQQFRRKRKSGKIVCVKGQVIRFPEPTGVALVIHRIRGITLPPKRITSAGGWGTLTQSRAHPAARRGDPQDHPGLRKPGGRGSGAPRTTDRRPRHRRPGPEPAPS